MVKRMSRTNITAIPARVSPENRPQPMNLWGGRQVGMILTRERLPHYKEDVLAFSRTNWLRYVLLTRTVAYDADSVRRRQPRYKDSGR